MESTTYLHQNHIEMSYATLQRYPLFFPTPYAHTHCQ